MGFCLYREKRARNDEKMAYVNRKNLQENELFIYQNSHVENTSRWCVSYKLNRFKRIHKSLGVVSETEAKRLAMHEFVTAQNTLSTYGEEAILGKNKIKDAVNWFKNEGQSSCNLKDERFKLVLGHWNRQFTKFFGANTVIDKKLQKRMRDYVEYRRRVIDRRTGKRLHASASTIRLEIASAQQVLNASRAHAGIGADVGSLMLKVDKTAIAKTKSKSTTFTHSEVEQLKELFDEDAAKLEEKLASAKPGAAALHLFYLRRLEFFVAVSLATGNRVNESRQIRHGDFSDDFKTVKIRESKTRHGRNRNAVIDSEIWNIEVAYEKFMNYAHTSNKNERVFANNVLTRGSDNLAGIGASFHRMLRKHRLLTAKNDGRRTRDFFATRHYYITKQKDDGVGSWDIAQMCGTSEREIRETYYETDASLLVERVEGIKAKTKRSNLRVVNGGKI